jgi:PAS domain S-box-containing protein
VSGTDPFGSGKAKPAFGRRFIGALIEGEREDVAERLVAIVQSSDDAIISKDLNGIITSWNAGATHIFGYSAEETIGQPVTILIPADHLDEEPGILERIRRGDRIEHYETVRKRKDGERIHISLTVSPIKNRHGTIVGASKIARDISRQKQIELQLREELERRRKAEETSELLLQEIQHRVKNTLGTVIAVAAQTFKTAPQAERKTFEARIRALANAHALLTQSNWSRTTLRQVIEQAVDPFQTERFVLEGPAVDLDAGKALTLTMLLHELATNAVKYGALSSDGGNVTIIWSLAGENASHVRLVWQERGGPPVSTPPRKGFGSTLIENALRGTQGNTRLQFDPEGVICNVDMTL